MTPEPIFEETQDLAWPWTLLGLGSCAAGGWGMAATRGALAGLGGAAAFVACASALSRAFLFPMRTRVADDAVEIRFGRVTRFRLPISEIESATLRTYRPIPEYAGWGIRFGATGT